jgi:hypothetical protein
VHTFVTVAHQTDQALLRLQARSFACHLDPNEVTRIIVVQNHDAGDSTWDLSKVASYYGAHASKVELHLGSRYDQGFPDISGWWWQQYLKLDIARLIMGEYYTVLDAKNHLVAPLKKAFLYGNDGRPKLRTYSYENHPLRPNLEHVLEYFDLPCDLVKWFPQTTTPCTLHTQTVIEAMKFLRKAENKGFASAMLDNKLPEFFLYHAYMRRKDVKGIYSSQALSESPVIWAHDAPTLKVLQAIGRAENEDLPFFSVHRKSLPLLDDAGREAIAQLWTRAKLFPMLIEARTFFTRELNPTRG